VKGRHRSSSPEVEGVVSSSAAVPGGVTVDTVNSAKRFNAFLVDEVDLNAADPRIEWICEDLIRRSDIRDPHDIDKLRALWVCVVARMQPPRVDRATMQKSLYRVRRFTEKDTCLPIYVDAIDMLHRETMSHIGLHNWQSDFTRIPYPASRGEPDQQLQEIILYYSVRLEHHTIAHAVEFVTENYLTMREALLLSNESTTDGDRLAAWNALAARIDEAYDIMCNRQLHNRIPLFKKARDFNPDHRFTVSDVARGTTRGDDGPLNAVQYPATSETKFRNIAANLEKIRGEDYVTILRPVGVCDEQRTIMFRKELGTLAGESRPAYGPPTKQGATVALDISYALEALHSAGITHGNINEDHIAYYPMDDGRVMWSLLPSTKMDTLNPERQKNDMNDLGTLLDRLATETKDSNSAKLVLELANASHQKTPLAIDTAIEHLEYDLGKRREVPDKPPSYEDLNQTGFDQREKHGGKNLAAPLVAFRRSFPEVGGLLAALTVYSWFIRYMLWQWVFCWASQPVSYLRPLCLQGTLEILSIADALLCVFTYAAEIRVLLGGAHHAKLVAAFVYLIGYAVAFVILMALVGFRTIFEGFLLNGVDLVISPHSIYVVIVVVLFLVKDIARFAWIGGRGEHRYNVLSAHPISKCTAALRTILYTFNWVLIIVPIALLTANWSSRDVSPFNETTRYFLPYIVALLASAVYNLILLFLANASSCCGAYWFRHLVIEGQLGAPAIFWALNYFMFFFLMTFFIVPGVAFIDWNLCRDVEWQSFLACNVAWVFNWLAFVIVSFALFGILYIGWSLMASILVAFARSIGELHSIRDVIQNIKVTRARARIIKGPLINVEGDLKRKMEAATIVFELVLQALVDDHKMTIDEKEMLLNWFRFAMKSDADVDPAAREKDLKRKIADATFRLSNDEAETVIVMFFATLELLPARKGYDVTSMPSFTVIVPHFNEPVYHDFKSMRCQFGDLASGVPSDLRHAAAQWPDEWRRLADQLRREGIIAPEATADELLETYHRICESLVLTEKAQRLVSAVELWVTYRNQTLARNIRGLGELRRGLAAVARLELTENEPFGADTAELDVRVERLVSEKFQVLIGAQTMANAACKCDPTKASSRMSRCQLVDMIEMQAAHPFCEIVFELTLTEKATPKIKFESMLEHARSEVAGIYMFEVHERFTTLCGTRVHYSGVRYFSCHVRLVEFTDKVRVYELHSVERPGPLLLGPKYTRMAPRGLMTQGKAENQFHTAQFARGANFFTLDMNQDMSITEGFKLPTMLHHFLGGNKRHRYGIIGFTERSYTRTTSLSGELAGAAEFAFVTIVQRVLRSALRIRMHYGHPDLMSGLMARTIGFHKASHGVNVNEDIFAGYECLARGVPIGFCEWLWFWKGRDVSLRLVAIFSNKLAEGAAQQVRSRDMHFLNANLDWLSRSSLLFGTIGFYWMSVLLYLSIRLYIWALLLYEVAGVTNYEIGVIGGIISVAWAFQLGYVMALPGLIENTVQFGFINGVVRFLRFLIASVFFHSFMLQVTCEGFLQGLFTNAAAYAGTGRGYDLTPVDCLRNFIQWGFSHYWRAVEFLVLLLWYASITSEPGISYFLRTLTVWVLVISMFGAPFYFQAAPCAFDLTRFGSKMWRWIMSAHQTFGGYRNLLLPDKIEEAEIKSYRTWYTRRFASPLYAAMLRNSNVFNWFEVLVSNIYRELPAVALLLVYFSVEMIPLMLTAVMIVVQVVLLRRMFSGRFKRHFSRIMLITTLVFVLCVAIFYLAADVLFFAPIVTLILVAYIVRFFGVMYVTFKLLRGTCRTFIKAGLVMSLLDFPAAIVAGTVTYVLAWLASNVFRDAVINWNYSAKLALECRRADFRRFSATARIPGEAPIPEERVDWNATPRHGASPAATPTGTPPPTPPPPPSSQGTDNTTSSTRAMGTSQSAHGATLQVPHDTSAEAHGYVIRRRHEPVADEHGVIRPRAAPAANPQPAEAPAYVIRRRTADVNVVNDGEAEARWARKQAEERRAQQEKMRNEGAEY
jgi:hypothetical protein